MKGRRSLLAGLLLLLATLAATACNSGASTKPAPTRTPTPNVVPETPAPAVIPTDDPGVIDAVADALRSDNADQIRSQIGFQRVPCAVKPPPGPGAPPACAGSEQSGQPVDAFYFSMCNGGYLRQSELQPALDVLAGTGLYGIYRLPPDRQANGQYSAVLVDVRAERAGKAWEAIIQNGHVVALIYSCALSPEVLVELRGYSETVVPP